MGQLPAGATTLLETVADIAALETRRREQPVVRHPDDPVGRRYERDGGGAEGALSDDRRAAQGRHLLRHHEPPGRRQARRPAGRCDDRGRFAEFLQLAASARGRRAGGLRAGAAPAAGGGYRLVAVRRYQKPRHHRRARPRRRFWSRKSSMLSRHASTCRSRASPRRMRACSFRSRANCASRQRNRRWRSTRRSWTRNCSRSSQATISANCCPTRASPKASRTPTTISTPPQGSYILTLYEKRVNESDLPFFLGLMQHLAAKGLNCPLPLKNRDGETLGRLAGTTRRRVHVSRRHRGTQAHRAALRRAWVGAGAAPSRRARLSDDAAEFPVGERLAAAFRASRVAGGPRLGGTCGQDAAGARTRCGGIGPRTCRAESSTPISSPTTSSSSAVRYRA